MKRSEKKKRVRKPFLKHLGQKAEEPEKIEKNKVRKRTFTYQKAP